MTLAQRLESGTGMVAWTPFVVAAVVSVLSSPLTAVWMLLVAPAVFLVGVWRLRSRRDEAPSTTTSVGLGLFVGPLLYVGAGLIIWAA